MNDPAGDQLLTAVAAYGLDTTRELPAEPLDGAGLAGPLMRIEGHRLLGFLGAAVAAGDIVVSDDWREALEDMLQAWLAHALRVERLLLDAADALTVAGIDHRVLKGVALAHGVYPDPGWRVFGDVDLLVPPDALTAAVGVLRERLGAVRDVPELRPGFDNRFGKEVLLRVGQLELDLHRSFVEGALGLTMTLPDLWVPPDHCEIGGTTVRVLPAPLQVLHAAYAVVLGDWPPRLVARRDLAQILAVRDPEPDGVLALARRWQAEAVLAQALVETWDSLGLVRSPPLVGWARGYHPGRVERLLVASHRGPARAYTRHAAALLVVPGIHGRLAYLRAIAWPQQAYLRARGTGRLGFVRRPLRVRARRLHR